MFPTEHLRAPAKTGPAASRSPPPTHNISFPPQPASTHAETAAGPDRSVHWRRSLTPLSHSAKAPPPPRVSSVRAGPSPQSPTHDPKPPLPPALPELPETLSTQWTAASDLKQIEVFEPPNTRLVSSHLSLTPQTAFVPGGGEFLSPPKDLGFTG
jgi:hypothetical protein